MPPVTLTSIEPSFDPVHVTGTIDVADTSNKGGFAMMIGAIAVSEQPLLSIATTS